MKITDFKKGAIIRRKGWEDNILISLNKNTGIVDFYINGVVTGEKKLTIEDITSDDWELNEKPTQVWKPNVGDKYYYISNTGSILYYMYDEDVTNKAIISIGNCFKTREEAAHMLEKIKIINKLRELSNIKFNENQKEKWSVIYDFSYNKVDCVYNKYTKCIPFEICFKTREDCQKAIETIGEDNLKKYYFEVVNDEKKN